MKRSISMDTPLEKYAFTACRNRRFYLSVRMKFALALLVAIVWTSVSVFIAAAWMKDLGGLTHPLFAPLLAFHPANEPPRFMR